MKRHVLFAKCICNTEDDYSHIRYDENGEKIIGKKVIEGLEIGKLYEVDSIYMTGWHTDVWLKDVEGKFNSICFDFYKNGWPKDIYNDPMYNPYL